MDQEEIEDDASLFVYPIESSCAAEDEQFYEVVELEDTQTRFQLDSGAKANVMSLRTYSNLQRNHLPVLKKTHIVRIGFLFQAQVETSWRSSVEHKISRSLR